MIELRFGFIQIDFLFFAWNVYSGSSETQNIGA